MAYITDVELMRLSYLRQSHQQHGLPRVVWKVYTLF